MNTKHTRSFGAQNLSGEEKDEEGQLQPHCNTRARPSRQSTHLATQSSHISLITSTSSSLSSLGVGLFSLSFLFSLELELAFEARRLKRVFQSDLGLGFVANKIGSNLDLMASRLEGVVEMEERAREGRGREEVLEREVEGLGDMGKDGEERGMGGKA